MKGLVFSLLRVVFTANAHAVDYLNARIAGITMTRRNTLLGRDKNLRA